MSRKHNPHQLTTPAEAIALGKMMYKHGSDVQANAIGARKQRRILAAIERREVKRAAKQAKAVKK